MRWGLLLADLVAHFTKISEILCHHLFRLNQGVVGDALFGDRVLHYRLGVFDDFEDKSTVGTADFLEEIVWIYPF